LKCVGKFCAVELRKKFFRKVVQKKEGSAKGRGQRDFVQENERKVHDSRNKRAICAN
jgi:hypothetical protein